MAKDVIKMNMDASLSFYIRNPIERMVYIVDYRSENLTITIKIPCSILTLLTYNKCKVSSSLLRHTTAFFSESKSCSNDRESALQQLLGTDKLTKEFK